jgi:flagellar transcriptional activator FlhC
MLDIYKRQTLALELIKRKARVAMIHEETNISIKWLRKAYRQYHGVSARSGDSKQSIHALTRTNKQYKEATAFAVCYRHAELILEQDGIHIAINAFDVFKTMCPTSQLDFSDAYLIAKNLQDRKIEVNKCQNCGSAVLIKARINFIEACVICRGLIR